MAISQFPPIELADENGLLALGGDLEVSSLLLAYKNGIFPWPISLTYPLAWFSPDPRGVLYFKNLHISESLKKFIKKTEMVVTYNQSFENVIMNCAFSKNRKDAHGEKSDQTWLTNQMIEAYIDFHYAGYAYSVEVWQDSSTQNLVGGLYGVCIGHFVSGESMFYTETNASKLALVSLMKHLQKKNIQWLDTQMVTGTVKNLGGTEIPRQEFIQLLQNSLSIGPTLSSPSLFGNA